MMRTIFLALVSLLICGQAGATISEEKFWDAETFVNTCKEKGGAELLCLGYITGIRETVYIIKLSPPSPELPKKAFFCAPESVTNEELQQIFIDYSTANPPVESDSPLFAVVKALRYHFPCK